MADPRDPNRNPLVLPTEKPLVRRNCCPVCGKKDFGGFMSGGVATFRCRACGNEWQGGVGQEPQDPRVPAPPQNPKEAPNVQFGFRKESGTMPVPMTVRRPDPTPEFRKGAPIPPPGEENDA